MIRVALDLENPEDLQRAKAQWKFAPGLVPGEPNEGLTARLSGSPRRGLPITTIIGATGIVLVLILAVFAPKLRRF